MSQIYASKSTSQPLLQHVSTSVLNCILFKIHKPGTVLKLKQF